MKTSVPLESEDLPHTAEVIEIVRFLGRDSARFRMVKRPDADAPFFGGV